MLQPLAEARGEKLAVGAARVAVSSSGCRGGLLLFGGSSRRFRNARLDLDLDVFAVLALATSSVWILLLAAAALLLLLLRMDLLLLLFLAAKLGRRRLVLDA